MPRVHPSLVAVALAIVACTAPPIVDDGSDQVTTASGGKAATTPSGTSRTTSSPQWSEKHVEGAAFVEGDMAFPNASSSTVAAGRTSTVRRWPKGIIPYDMEPGMLLPERVAQAAQHYLAKTGIHFIPRTNETDYVHFFNGDGCYSYIGLTGGQQPISIQLNAPDQPGCYLPQVIHEMGHAVGLAHEQSRSDRDDYVIIHPENILDGQQHNFDKTNFQSIGAYDLGSIMQYPSDAFSKNGQPTVTRKDGGLLKLGDGLSDKDVAGILEYYDGELQGGDNGRNGTPSTVTLSWSKKSETATYSLDVLADGQWIAPCVNAGVLQRSTSTMFDGSCPAPVNQRADLASIKAFRICWAENDDWGHALCATAAYSGLTVVNIAN